ncbi:hypothetical protein [Mycobacteroides salmoniphilum]|uniref:hypothetical protein n=1 Tax=Mycobacteroides salmoniphilum TaxID=404941 RepID=UPI001066A1DF|nr:hypothetical protein [Mycobacteroides salmoniphilum]
MAFSDVERAVDLDLELTPRQAAEQLGRTVATIRQMRTKDRLRHKPVPEGKHGTHYAWRTYGCRCQRCVQAHRDHDKNVWRANIEVREKKAAANAAWRATHPDRVGYYDTIKHEYEAARTVPGAVNHKQPWSDADLAAALDMSLTAVQVAQRLGRTAYAVIAVRTKQRDRRWWEVPIRSRIVSDAFQGRMRYC